MASERRRKSGASAPQDGPTSDGAKRPPAAGRPASPRISGTFVHFSVANEIGQRIVRGDYPPGTILPNEAEWSEMFGVGRSVVREAIKMLMAKNLLASRPKIGSWVQPRERWNLLDREVLTWYAASPERREFLQTVQEFRYIIEPEAAALAARNLGAEQMFLEVAEDNAAALALYRRAGFEAAGRRRGYYPREAGAAVDALLLVRKLPH